MIAQEQPRSEALAWLDEAAADGSDALVQPYIDAAAVLSSFDPATLNPASEVNAEFRDEALIRLIDVSNPVVGGAPGHWQLEENTRREALRRLGSHARMREARAANPGPAADPLQEGFDRLIEADGPADLEALSLPQLLGLERAAGWIAGVLDPLPDAQALLARIERERLFEPLRRLAERGFVGRKEELRRLADYVGVLPPETLWQNVRRGYKYVQYAIDQRPPLLIHGPGGVGKSTLLARFILDHAAQRHSQPLPFVYLDFDRAALDPRRPHTLMGEAIRQIATEFPYIAAEIGPLGDEWREHATAFESVETAKSAHFGRAERLVSRFARLMKMVAEWNVQPVLLVLDTLEEAEYQGESALRVIWESLGTLLRQVDRLRIVAVGRSPLPPYLPKEPVELTGFDPETATEFLVARSASIDGGPISRADARIIVDLVGTVPLSLALAARVVLDEGLDALRGVIGRRRLFTRIKAEQQQGLLYTRILRHLHEDDPDLEKIVFPGLIVRRITPDIIREVLAGPCGLALGDDGRAEDLFARIEREVSLVDPYREPGAVWHLSAVRRLMLPELRKRLGVRAQAIHEAAVRYYAARTEPVALSEQIYHRLCLGQTGPELDRLWQSGLEAYLRGAFGDLESEGKIWLADKLGIELDSALRAQANLALWELQAAQRARTLLENRLVEEALAALRERPDRTAASLLYPLEVDALQLLGRLDEARAVAETGLSRATAEGDRAATLPMLLRLVAVEERRGEFAGATDFAREALTTARELDDPLDELSAGVAVLRLRRKAAESGRPPPDAAADRTTSAPERDEPDLKARLIALLAKTDVRQNLKTRPALLRECAAELGAALPDLLAEAIELLGVSPADQLALIEHAKASGTPLSAKEEHTLATLGEAKTSRGMGRTIAGLASAYPEFLAGRLSNAVEGSLHQTVGVGPAAGAASPDIELDRKQRRELSEILMSHFDAPALQFLLADYLDVDLMHVVPPNASFSIQIYSLIEWLRQTGRMATFLKVLDEIPSENPDVRDFLQRLRPP